MEPPLWTEGASPWPHEREALGFVRSRLPNYEPYRAWSNVEFIADDGSVNEVDLLVVTTKGFFVVEVKSWLGVLVGEGQKWRLKRPNGADVSMDHPLILANTKAKRLRSLLARQTPFRKQQPPWATALVFLSSAELDCRLNPIARTNVCGRESSADGKGLPGIIDVLKNPAAGKLRETAINRPLSAKIAEALDRAGLKASIGAGASGTGN